MDRPASRPDLLLEAFGPLAATKRALASQSTPQLRPGLPDLDYSFPIRSHPRRKAKKNKPVPKLIPSKSTGTLRLSRRKQLAASPPMIEVNGGESDAFETKLELVRGRPLAQLLKAANSVSTPRPLNKAHMALIQREMAALTVAVDEMYADVVKDMEAKVEDPLEVTKRTRGVIASSMNAMFRLNAKYFPAHSTFVANAFGRCDQLVKQYRSLVLIGEHRAEGKYYERMKALQAKLRSAAEEQTQLEDRIGQLETMLAASEASRKATQRDLEYYRKYVFVKTGRLNLNDEAWGSIITSSDLPTLEYMREEHPTQAALVEAKMEAAKAAYSQADDTIDENAELLLQQGRNAGIQIVSDCLENLERHAVEMGDLFEDHVAPAILHK